MALFCLALPTWTVPIRACVDPSKQLGQRFEETDQQSGIQCERTLLGKGESVNRVLPLRWRVGLLCGIRCRHCWYFYLLNVRSSQPERRRNVKGRGGKRDNKSIQSNRDGSGGHNFDNRHGHHNQHNQHRQQQRPPHDIKDMSGSVRVHFLSLWTCIGGRPRK